MADMATKDDLAQLRTEFQAEFRGVRGDLKEQTKALQELVRLDGDISRLDDAMHRIGHEAKDHEKRIRELEMNTHTNSRTREWFERIVLIGFGAIAAEVAHFAFTFSWGAHP